MRQPLSVEAAPIKSLAALISDEAALISLLCTHPHLMALVWDVARHVCAHMSSTYM
jgi:hypothetical protein